ncbi:MAG TPA: SpoIIE family protein phosphatase [Lachnospiraceae bacterium]|nr:SpoIIE family protein phosphatase [Lachnospiraceae bacterium]
MRKELVQRENIHHSLLPEYGKKRLLTYADSFKDLAKTFTCIPKEETNDGNRMAYLWKRRLMENRGLLAEHLNEMAEIIMEVAEEAYMVIPIEEKKKKKIGHALKEQGIELINLFRLENKLHRLELGVTLSTKNTSGFSTEEIAGILSVNFNKRLMPTRGSVTYLREKPETIIFEEESKYGFLTGVAKAIKENEVISGDNYSISEIGNGNLIVALSDGMGSGEKACQDSQMVVELFEKFLEANFSKDMAVQMINGALIASAEEQNMSTLDVCHIDLYTGDCEFLKVGAATTFIKSANLVEIIPSGSLPLGVFHQMEIEHIKSNLNDGDYVIMVSDGITDFFTTEEDELALEEMIRRIHYENPREIANCILNNVICQSKGEIKDDMTVLVIGIWENTP